MTITLEPGDSGWIAFSERAPPIDFPVFYALLNSYDNAPWSWSMGVGVWRGWMLGYSTGYFTSEGHHIYTPQYWRPVPEAPPIPPEAWQFQQLGLPRSSRKRRALDTT